MYCGQCGSFVKDGAQFCPCCGAIMDMPELDDAGEYTGRSVRKAQVKKRRKWPWVLAVLLIILLAVGAAVYWFWFRQAAEEDSFVSGQDSYTALISAYLEAASANDEEAVLDLFFPNSDLYYQNAEGSLTTLQILAQEDSWIAVYGEQVSQAELGDVQFADLSGEQASAVAAVLAEYSDLESISELYTVSASVTYTGGTSIDMVFEVMQCEYGCYLVAIQ